jgi:hypothetical protein
MVVSTLEKGLSWGANVIHLCGGDMNTCRTDGGDWQHRAYISFDLKKNVLISYRREIGIDVNSEGELKLTTNYKLEK